MRRLLQLAKDHIILFGTAKFLAGWLDSVRPGLPSISEQRAIYHARWISGSQVRRAANRAH